MTNPVKQDQRYSDPNAHKAMVKRLKEYSMQKYLSQKFVTKNRHKKSSHIFIT